MPTFRQGDWAKAESHTKAWAQEWDWIRSWGWQVYTTWCPKWGSCPTTHFSWLLEARISCLHRPEMSLIHYPGKWGKKESSGSWNPIRGCRPFLGGRGSLEVPLPPQSGWAPASPSPQYSPLQILELWSGGAIAYVKSCIFSYRKLWVCTNGFLIPTCTLK